MLCHLLCTYWLVVLSVRMEQTCKLRRYIQISCYQRGVNFWLVLAPRTFAPKFQIMRSINPSKPTRKRNCIIHSCVVVHFDNEKSTTIHQQTRAFTGNNSHQKLGVLSHILLEPCYNWSCAPNSVRRRDGSREPSHRPDFDTTSRRLSTTSPTCLYRHPTAGHRFRVVVY